jgi:Arc/MetJ-type ribon-helix-helix transcriptional regulator
MTTISLKIDEKLAAGLDAEVRARRTNRSELCREALSALLRKSGKSKPSLLQQSKDLCGAGSSGRGDLSSNPRHLAGFGGKAR